MAQKQTFNIRFLSRNRRTPDARREAEALTNAAKHARCSAVSVEAEIAGEVLRVAVRDDGVGGADFTKGTGLGGLKDRVEAIGGRIFLDSPRGEGTSLRVELPLTSGDITIPVAAPPSPGRAD
jgi:glucose-6-phosphate-specific signal transduction histidine kinase